jgi:hypothetical protein
MAPLFDDVRTAEDWIRQTGRSAAITTAYTSFRAGKVEVSFADPPNGARAVVFPGAGDLVGVLTVAEVVARSAIERVIMLGGGAQATATQELDTHGFVRPQWIDGALTLVVQPGSGGRLVPFESPSPTPCCADHG